jgi:hypothetical protein
MPLIFLREVEEIMREHPGQRAKMQAGSPASKPESRRIWRKVLAE